VLDIDGGDVMPKRPAKRSAQRESPLLADVRLAVGSRQDCTFFRVNTGVFKPMFAKPGDRRVIRSAPTGFPDLIGIQRRTVTRKQVINADSFTPYEKIGPHTYGQSIAVETKAAKGVQSAEQVAFQAEFERCGGLYILARSVQDVLDVLGPDTVAAAPRSAA
jgi:hypothetical protein